MLIPLLVAITIFIGFLSFFTFIIWKFKKEALQSEIFWQLVNILVDYPDIVWEDIELILGITSPNEPLRNFVRQEIARGTLVETIARELMKRWLKRKRFSSLYWLHSQ